MVELIGQGSYLIGGQVVQEAAGAVELDRINKILAQEGQSPVSQEALSPERARANTIAFGIMSKHNTSRDWRNLKIRFDAMASHDITYVGIVQTARASGLKHFPVPYVLTNCHNSLCAVGGTINEDDHRFGLSAAQKYGGIFVPAHQAVIHQYMREMMSGCGRMILGSDSHTRYGALGTMGVGEGGPELVKQLLERTYDLSYPEVIAVYLEGQPPVGVGPQDVALALIKAVFANGFVKNKVLEFVGPGVANLTVDYRNGIDVMTTETTCLSSIWRTDVAVAEYFKIHGRAEAYQELEPGSVAYYDGVIKIDLSRVEAMIALPFHPSNVFTINELNNNAAEILTTVEVEAKQQLENSKLEFSLRNKIQDGRLRLDQGVVAGCAGGTFENIGAMAAIIGERSLGDGEFGLSIYPASQPVNLELTKDGIAAKLMAAGAIFRTAFCGPCFGAGDVPANGAISARHSTRNFPNREGSKPSNGQIASVALMDARSIAATAINGGRLTAATEVKYPTSNVTYSFNKQVYDNRVYQGYGKPQPELELKFGPNIADWPEMIPLPENLLLRLAAVIHDPVTTTDELIPSGETSSYRSNPLKLAEFTLSRKDPQYVGRAKEIQMVEIARRQGAGISGIDQVVKTVTDGQVSQEWVRQTGIGSVIFANKPGDGSAREQAASCQRVLGGCANVAVEYATKRYRSNLMNWGMLPLTVDPAVVKEFAIDDFIYLPGIREIVANGGERVPGFVVKGDRKVPVEFWLKNLSVDDREIILAGCLINYYASGK